MATCVVSEVDGTLISLQPRERQAYSPLRALLVPRAAIDLHEDRVGFTDYLFDWLSCVSSCTGIGTEVLYVAGGQCCYDEKPLLLPTSSIAAIEALWDAFYDLRDTYRVLGTGLYLAYYLSSISTGSTKTKYGLLDGTVTSLVLTHVELGQSLRRLREEGALGARSIRQNGAVAWYHEGLYTYWSSFRPTEVLDGIMMVSHLCDSELDESRARLEAGLIPYRRYNTPVMRRAPRSPSNSTPSLRATYKWMAWELLRTLRALANLTPLPESAILIDKKGILRIPMEIPSLEYAFASLWSKINEQWNRIYLVQRSSPSEDGLQVVTVDDSKYTIFLDDKAQ